MQHENLNAGANSGAGLSLGSFAEAELSGRYTAVLRDKDGNVKWEDEFDNLVTTVGKNLALDTLFAGSSYSVVGPYLGLINGSASSAAAGDVMSSHAAWLEVGGANAPAYSGTRKTLSFSSASGGSKTTSVAATFTFTSGGTVGGCFLVLGTGALSTIDNTAGTLYSAGAFTGGSKTVGAADTLSVNYTSSL